MFLLFFILSLVNIYTIWLIMELIFLYFLLLRVVKDEKRDGLVLYFFFQSIVSLLLFITISFSLNKFLFILLCAKLGIFPFFYWIVIVSVKVGYFVNMFVLGLQKFSVFWIIWLRLDVDVVFVYFFVYLSVFFVVVSLLIVSDLWLLLVYSSIGNTAIIVLGVYGSQYLVLVFLYLSVVFFIIVCLFKISSFSDLMILVFFFLVIPPFFLFFIKFFLVISLDFVVKFVFYLMVFDVLVLLYYFSLIFMKFILLERGVLIYIINFLVVLFIIIFRIYVTMIIFN